MNNTVLQHTAAIEWFHYLAKIEDPRLPSTVSRLEHMEQCLHTLSKDLGLSIKAVSLTHKHFYDNTPLWKVTYRDFTCEIQLADCTHWEYLAKKSNDRDALKKTIHEAIARKISGKNTLQYHTSVMKSHRKKTAFDFFKKFNVFHGYNTFCNMVSLCDHHPILGNYSLEACAVLTARTLRRFPIKEQLFLLMNSPSNLTSWRALPWDALRQARAAWRKEGIGSMGAHQQWQNILGFPLTNYHFHNTFKPESFKLKTWKILIEKYQLALTKGPRKGYVDSGIGHPLINLIHIFDTPQMVEKMALAFNELKKKENTWYNDRSHDIPKLLHDLGDFTLLRSFSDDEKKVINQWCIQHPEMLKYLGSVQSYLYENTLTTYDHFITTLKYKSDTPLARLCSEVEMPSYNYVRYKAFWEENTPKTYDVVPNITVTSDRFILRKLDPHDLRGPMLGLYTSCCQHLHSTAAKTAQNGVLSPYSAFYVLTDKKDNILSQAYVWINTSGDVIIDSIEGIFQTEDNRWSEVSHLWKEAVLALSEHCAVYLGDTDYGMTKDIKNDWRDDIRFSWSSHTTLPQDTDSYFDGLTHHHLSGTSRNRFYPENIFYKKDKDSSYNI